MRHLLNWLLLAIRPDDGLALLGDLEQEYPSVRRSLGWMRAQVWYARELCAAVGYGVCDAYTTLTVGSGRMEMGSVTVGFRVFRNHSGYVAMASGVLALAIGMNLLVFAIANALWIRPLPVFEPEQVVTVLQFGATVGSLTSPRLEMFEGPLGGQVVTTGYREAFTPRIAFPQIGESLETLGVTPQYFTVLGVPVRGRVFTDADEVVGAEGVAIISDRLWTRAFGRRADVIGSVVAATPSPLRIVGIAPPGFEGARCRSVPSSRFTASQVPADSACPLSKSRHLR